MTVPGERLRFLDGQGLPVEAKTLVEGEDPVPAPAALRAVLIRLEPPGEPPAPARMLGVPPGNGPHRDAYEPLDNEILAGLRLLRLAGRGPYPKEVSRLIGYDAESARPFALLEPYRGLPVAEITESLFPHQWLSFQLSLFTALRWLAAAGLAHRGLDPRTVRWDGEHVQITDFSRAALIGTPRTVTGAPPWWAPEQRPGGPVEGEVSDRDDLWAAARLIHYTVTGRELTEPADLEEVDELAPLRDRILGPPDGRPDALEMLRLLGETRDPVPRGTDTDDAFARGRAEFFEYRDRKHPQPPEEPVPTETTPASFTLLGCMVWVALAVSLITIVVLLVRGR